MAAVLTSVVLLIALGAPPVPVLVGAALTGGASWWRSGGSR